MRDITQKGYWSVLWCKNPGPSCLKPAAYRDRVRNLRSLSHRKRKDLRLPVELWAISSKGDFQG